MKKLCCILNGKGHCEVQIGAVSVCEKGTEGR